MLIEAEATTPRVPNIGPGRRPTHRVIPAKAGIQAEGAPRNEDLELRTLRMPSDLSPE